MLTVVNEEAQANLHAPAAVDGVMLDELAREGARQMLAAALQAEVAAYVDASTGEVDEDGRRLVVRNGYHGAREVAAAAGTVPVRAPRVNVKRVVVESLEKLLCPGDFRLKRAVCEQEPRVPLAHSPSW